MNEESKRWIQAGVTLAREAKARVKCPVCQQAELDIQDQLLGDGRFERHMRCPRCGAYNSMLMNRT